MTSTIPHFISSRPQLKEKDFTLVRNFIYSRFGIKLDPCKKTLVETRLSNRVVQLGFDTFEAYLKFALDAGNQQERNFLRDAITTNKTEFFREIDHFDFLQKDVLPNISSGHLKVWSAACSSGEEVYSLAMLLEEFATTRALRYEILGTDISEKVLNHAKRAIYKYTDVAPVPDLFKHKYLLRSKDQYSEAVKIRPEIRKHTQFSHFNLMTKSYEHGKYDLIFCRNVLIYFDYKTQVEVIQKLEKCLKPGGYLFIGHSETIIGMKTNLKRVRPTVYKLPEH
jgi:chemotaxis protein methyltransferase CheR